MKTAFYQNWLRYVFALVWVVNGLFCKILDLVPRHQQIVERIIETQYPRELTMAIGVAELGMAGWILSGFGRQRCGLMQIFLVAVMNILEFFLAADLLLWGKVNAVFASGFIALLYYHYFFSTKTENRRTACYPS